MNKTTIVSLPEDPPTSKDQSIRFPRAKRIPCAEHQDPVPCTVASLQMALRDALPYSMSFAAVAKELDYTSIATGDNIVTQLTPVRRADTDLPFI